MLAKYIFKGLTWIILNRYVFKLYYVLSSFSSKDISTSVLLIICIARRSNSSKYCFVFIPRYLNQDFRVQVHSIRMVVTHHFQKTN